MWSSTWIELLDAEKRNEPLEHSLQATAISSCYSPTTGSYLYQQPTINSLYQLNGSISASISSTTTSLHQPHLISHPLVVASRFYNFHQPTCLEINFAANPQSHNEIHEVNTTLTDSLNKLKGIIYNVPTSLPTADLNFDANNSNVQCDKMGTSTIESSSDCNGNGQSVSVGTNQDLRTMTKKENNISKKAGSGIAKATLKKSSNKSKKNESKWLSCYDELKQFKRQNGHTVVPRGFANNPKLASWVSEQRKQYRHHVNSKKTSITIKRVALLNEIGFVWDAQAGAWERQFEQLQQFHLMHGHCHVPIKKNKKYLQLALWVKEQRRHYALMKQSKESRMTLERFERLSALNFCFSEHEERWQHQFEQLEKFKEENGHCIVTSSNASAGLVTWVHHQRRQYKKIALGQSSHLLTKRIEDLNALGFVWSRKQSNTEILEESDSDSDDDSSIGSNSNGSISEDDTSDKLS